jgi:O-antigen/teichoic acid export membrane protein
MRHQAIWDALNKLVMLVALVVIVVLDLGFNAYLALSIVSAVLSAVPGVVLMYRYLPFPVFSFDGAMARRLVVQSLPFCTFGVMLAIYPAIDVYLLSRLANERAVGIYSTPFRIFGTLLFAPTIIMTVVFPRLAASYVDSPAELNRIARSTMNVVLGISLPVALLTAGAGNDFLPTLVGRDFSDSGPVLMLLAAVLVPTSINMVAHRVLMAVDRQKHWTIVMCVGVVAKIALDLALIPAFEAWFGNAALGAAAGFLAVEAGMTVAALVLMPHGINDRASGFI